MTILAAVLPVIGIIGAGYVYGRYRSLPAAELSDLLFWIMIPCLVLGQIGTHPISPSELCRIGAGAVLVVAGCGLLTMALFARSTLRRAALLPAMFMNSANMAFPLAFLAFGDEGLARQLVFYIAVNLLHVTVGIWIARGRGGLGEVFKLPLVYAAALAITLACTGIVLPAALSEPLDLVGKATIPLMLLLLGVRLRTAKMLNVWPALSAGLIRLVAGFGLGVLAVWMLDLTGFARTAVLLGSAMPAAVFNFILSEKYSLRPEFVATSVVLSTVLSFATTPLVLWYITAA